MVAVDEHGPIVTLRDRLPKLFFGLVLFISLSLLQARYLLISCLISLCAQDSLVIVFKLLLSYLTILLILFLLELLSELCLQIVPPLLLA